MAGTNEVPRLIDAEALKESLCGDLERIAATAYFKLRQDALRMSAAIRAAIDSAPTINEPLNK